ALALVVVVLVGVLPWIILSGLQTILGKVISTAAVIAPIVAIPTIELWGIRLWRSGWSILHQTIPRWLGTRGSCGCLPLLLSTMGGNTVLLCNGQVDQLIVGVGLNKVQAFL